jgi:hypothetical protein
MDRRAFVRGLAACLGGAVAGCTSGGEVPETAPSPPAAVREATPADADGADSGGDRDGAITTNVVVDDPEGANAVVLLSQNVLADDGDLVVTVGVGNEGTVRSTVLVRTTVRTESAELTLERFVDLRPGEERVVRFGTDRPRDAFEGMSVRILAETPATPLPTETPSPTPTERSSLTGAGDDGDG